MSYYKATNYTASDSLEFWIPKKSTDISYKIVSKSNILYFTATYDISLKKKMS